MAQYCSADELTNLTGTSLSTTIKNAIIDQSDREIRARILIAGLSAPASDETLKAASLNISKAGIITYDRMSGAKTSSIKVGDISMSDNLDAIVAELYGKAWTSVDSYIRTNGTHSRDRWYLRKVNR